MGKKILLSIFVFYLASIINATSFFTSDFNSYYKSFDDDVALFFNNNNFFKNGYPKMNIFENKEYYIFKFELPGIDKKDIDVKLHNQNILSINGAKKELSKEEKESMIKQERFYGSFSRNISLPDDIDPNSIKVTHKNGILKVVIQKDQKKIKEKVKNLTIE